ncbi:MAG: HAD family phosphatase [Ignavibacteriales bacterium]|nr:MAG: HAD family phosphatase [Ignavibacteriales bacterium]
MKNKYSDYAIIFDMDGVIADTNPYHSLAWKSFAEKYNFTINDEDLKNHVFGRTNKSIFDFLFGDSLSPEKISLLANEKEVLFRDIYKNNIKALPGLVELLISIKNNFFKIGMATSAPSENVSLIVDELRINKFFDVIVDPKDITRSKPDPEIYIKCSQLLSVIPERCLVFEDSLPGIEAAVSAGMKVIGITSTHSSDELKNTLITIDDFLQIDINKIKEILK